MEGRKVRSDRDGIWFARVKLGAIRIRGKGATKQKALDVARDNAADFLRRLGEVLPS